MFQLKLTKEELLEIGFIENNYPASEDEFSSEKTTFEIPCLNGCFYYNPNEENKVWYQKIVIGDYSNHINLDITSRPVLYNVLDAFKVKFNLIIF